MSSLPTISTASTGDRTPTTAGSPQTPTDVLDKKDINDHTKEDVILIGHPIIVYGVDDDLPSYYIASSAPNSRPASSVQGVPSDIDPSEPHAL